MKKSLALAIVMAIGLSSTVFASPMTDFQRGKTEIEYSRGFNGSFDVINNVGYRSEPDVNTAYNFKVTHSFDNDWAIQYVQQRVGTDPLNDGRHIPEVFTIRTKQANIIYQANKYIYPFVGARWASFASEYEGDTLAKLKQTNMQFGVTAAAKLSPRFDVSATSAFGKDFYDISTEFTYELSKTNKTKLGIGYQWLKYDEFDVPWNTLLITTRHSGPSITLTMGF